LNETIENIEGKMPISSKRIGSHQTNHQSVPQANEYDDYVYYPYYSKTASNDGYEYEEQQPTEYYKTRATNSSAPVHRP
jgi:hypothetical protein